MLYSGQTVHIRMYNNTRVLFSSFSRRSPVESVSRRVYILNMLAWVMRVRIEVCT
jgi:hypothetical protein